MPFSKSLMFAVCIVASNLLLHGGELDPARMPASGWMGNVGIPGGIPNDYVMFCNVRDSIPGTTLKATGDGEADDYSALNYAVQHCPDKHYVYLPAGTYRLDQGIERRGGNSNVGTAQPFSIVIKGDGPSLTKLLFFGKGTAIAFTPAGGPSTRPMPIVDGDRRGSTSLRIDSLNSNLQPGLYAVVHRLNGNATMGHDPAYMKDTASQMVRVTAVHDATKTIDFWPALNESYPGDFLSVGFSPPLRCGIEDLSIENMTNSHGHNIRVAYGQECWIRNVESIKASKWHIRLEDCARCEVRECYVHDGWDGGGDSIYGVGLFEFCCNNLVEDNVASHCRHSYITEYGGQGNVFGYNYSRDPLNERQLNTDYLMGDLVHHGGEPRWNLWEGNVASEIKFDCVLGGSAFNTVFRNLIRRKGLPSTYVACFGSDIQRWNINENLLGNIYEAAVRLHEPLRRWGTRQDDLSEIDARPQATAMLDGEYDVEGNSVYWNGPDHALPRSYYLDRKPDWFGTLSWPPIDPSHPGLISPQSIPAGRRWLTYLAAKP